MPGDARSVKAACISLRDEDAKVRPAYDVADAVAPLLIRRCRSVLDPLSTCALARQLAAQALGQLALRGDPEVVEMLLERLQASIRR